MTGPAADLNIYGFTPTFWSFNKEIYSVKLAVREARICFNRKILPSFTAVRARSSNRKQIFFRRLRRWWNFSTSLVELFLSEIFGNARFYLFSNISKLLWIEWVAYLFFSANFTLISEKWLWSLEYPFNYRNKSERNITKNKPKCYSMTSLRRHHQLRTS